MKSRTLKHEAVPENVCCTKQSRLQLIQPKQAFSPFFGKNSNFISVTLSQQGFQTVRGGKMCLRYFYAFDAADARAAHPSKIESILFQL